MAPPKMLYQLRITLLDTQPKIWRRIQIPTSVTFLELHSAIQDVFHWSNFIFRNNLSVIFGSNDGGC